MRTLSDMQRAYDARSDDEPEEPEDGGFNDFDSFNGVPDAVLQKMIDANRQAGSRAHARQWADEMETILQQREKNKP